MLIAQEFDDVLSDGNLTAEFQSGEEPTVEDAPKSAFQVIRTLTEFSRAMNFWGTIFRFARHDGVLYFGD